MFEWLTNLLRRRGAGRRVDVPPAEAAVRDFPTSKTIAEWDDQGLFVATGCESAFRHHRDGFTSLNHVERSLCCLYLLEADINNGGVGHWIECLCPYSAVETVRILHEIGATEMAAFATDALLPLGDTTGIQSKEAWVDHYLSMPDHVHEHWETLTKPFLELEDRFLDLAYKYAREHWVAVRVP